MPRAREAASAPHKPRCPSSSKGSFSLFLILSPPAAGIPDKRDGAQGGRSASASQLKPDHHNCCPEGLRYPCSGGGGGRCCAHPKPPPGLRDPKGQFPREGWEGRGSAGEQRASNPHSPWLRAGLGALWIPRRGVPAPIHRGSSLG